MLAPTIKAILSIQNYISRDIPTSFKQIYDSLRDKLLKKQPNEAAMRIIGYFTIHSDDACRNQVQQMLIDELRKVDKRHQLAVVVLLQFLMKQYHESMREAASIFLVPLTELVETRSDQPTLLTCSACELALQCVQIALSAPPNIVTRDASTAKIIEVEVSAPIDRLLKIWNVLDRILSILEKVLQAVEVLQHNELTEQLLVISGRNQKPNSN